MTISIKLVYQYMPIFFNFSHTSNHLRPLQVENCDSNSQLVVEEDDNSKFRLERVKGLNEFFGFRRVSKQRIITLATVKRIIYRMLFLYI